MVEALFVADDLDRHGLTGAVVTALQDLTKRALAEDAHDLVPVGEVVALDDQVVPSIVVVPVVEADVVELGHLLLAALADAVDGRVLGDLAALVVGKIVVVLLDRSCKGGGRREVSFSVEFLLSEGLKGHLPRGVVAGVGSVGSG